MYTLKNLTVEDTTAFKTVAEQSGLDLDLFSLIASTERVLPKGLAGLALTCAYTVNLHIGVTVAELAYAVEYDSLLDLGAEMLLVAYRDMIHQASLKCHKIDPSITPWEYEDLRRLTMEEHLKKAGIALDKCVELKG